MQIMRVVIIVVNMVNNPPSTSIIVTRLLFELFVCVGVIITIVG